MQLGCNVGYYGGRFGAELKKPSKLFRESFVFVTALNNKQADVMSPYTDSERTKSKEYKKVHVPNASSDWQNFPYVFAPFFIIVPDLSTEHA